MNFSSALYNSLDQNIKRSMDEFEKYLYQDQFDFEAIEKEDRTPKLDYDDEFIEQNPLFIIRKARSLINDSDDHIWHSQEVILKSLEQGLDEEIVESVILAN